MKVKVEGTTMELMIIHWAQVYADKKILIKVWVTEDDREYGEPDIIPADDFAEAFKEVQYFVKNNDFQCIEIYADDELLFYKDNIEQYFLTSLND